MRKRPNVARYWERIQARPSFKDSKSLLLRPWFVNSCTISVLFLAIDTLLNVVIFGVLSLFIEFKTDWWLFALAGGLGLFMIILLIFVCLGRKTDRFIESFRARLYHRDRSDPEFVNGL